LTIKLNYSTRSFISETISLIRLLADLRQNTKKNSFVRFVWHSAKIQANQRSSVDTTLQIRTIGLSIREYQNMKSSVLHATCTESYVLKINAKDIVFKIKIHFEQIKKFA